MKARLVWMLVFTALLCGPVARASVSTPPRPAIQIRKELRVGEARLALEKAHRARILRVLHRTTHALQHGEQALRRLREERTQLVPREEALNRHAQQIHRQFEKERQALLRLVQTRFILGREARLRFLLSSGSVSRLSRLLGEWSMVNRATTIRLRVLDRLETRLASAQNRVHQTEAQIHDLEASQVHTDLLLQAEEARRSALLAALTTHIRSQQSRLDALRLRYRELKAMWVHLSSPLGPRPLRAGSPLARVPFPRLRGRLPWPVRGIIVRGFGSPEAGGRLLSHGLLIKARRDALVRAVAHGEVVFSGWLPNFGLLAVVAQGRGYYTVYADNTVLYDQVGDWINAGDPIGRLGSGRVHRPALYFQIRHGSEPIDPAPWLAPPDRGSP